jgi:hypothetical protein
MDLLNLTGSTGEKVLSLYDINTRINKEYCVDTVIKLKDYNLMNEYNECKSVKKEINKLTEILDKHKIETEKKESILNDYLLELVPAGTKGIIRGNKFNKIVEQTIKKINLNINNFEVCFEKNCSTCLTSEIPDWYILEKFTGKVIIGMNQLDLWGGGQQINRGYKYLVNNPINTERSKLVCVVCNKIKFTSNKSKAYKLFEIGYQNDTLCYLKNLKSIIKKYFKLK